MFTLFDFGYRILSVCRIRQGVFGSKRLNVEKVTISETFGSAHEDDPLGPIREYKVLRTFENGLQNIAKLYLRVVESGKEFFIRTFVGHRLYLLDGVFEHAQDVPIGSRMINYKQQVVEVLAVELEAEPELVYNFEVEDAHTYFVGDDAECCVLGHNQDCASVEKPDVPFGATALYGFTGVGQMLWYIPRKLRLTNLVGLEGRLQEADQARKELHDWIWVEGGNGITFDRALDRGTDFANATSAVAIILGLFLPDSIAETQIGGNGNPALDAGTRIRHHTDSHGLQGIQRDGAIKISDERVIFEHVDPPGVYGEQGPPWKPEGAERFGRAGMDHFIEFDKPNLPIHHDIASPDNPEAILIETPDPPTPLPIGNLHPKFVKPKPWWQFW